MNIDDLVAILIRLWGWSYVVVFALGIIVGLLI